MYEEQPIKIVSPTYLSYLVRFWRSTSSPEWLASLEAPGTHERHSFADLTSFFAFLAAQTGIETTVVGQPEQRKARDRPYLDGEPP